VRRKAWKTLLKGVNELRSSDKKKSDKELDKDAKKLQENSDKVGDKLLEEAKNQIGLGGDNGEGSSGKKDAWELSPALPYLHAFLELKSWILEFWSCESGVMEFRDWILIVGSWAARICFLYAISFVWRSKGYFGRLKESYVFRSLQLLFSS